MLEVVKSPGRESSCHFEESLLHDALVERFEVLAEHAVETAEHVELFGVDFLREFGQHSEEDVEVHVGAGNSLVLVSVFSIED